MVSVNLFLLLAVIYVVTFVLGRVLEKIRIPWLFGALLLGLVFSIGSFAGAATESIEFGFLAQLGLLFTLFIIGFEIDLKALKKLGSFIVRASMVIIGLEIVVGSVLLHTFFALTWPLALLVATSFATVGEAILLPILDEFNLTKKPLGQTILGVGVIDDVLELATIVAVSFVIGAEIGHAQLSLPYIVLVIVVMFSLPFLLRLLRPLFMKAHYYSFEYFFLLALATLFGLVGLSSLIDAAALGAIIAGVSLRTFAPQNLLSSVESQLKALSYGVFAPVFFVSVGLNVELGYLQQNWLLIVVISLATAIAKIVGSYVVARKRLGAHQAIVMGISLTVRLSSSIVVITVLAQQGLISERLFAVLIGSTIVFKFVVPTAIAALSKRWNIGDQNPVVHQRRRKSMPVTNRPG